MSEAGHPRERTRLDTWLWQARFCKSRAKARRMVEEGKIRLNRMIVNRPAHKLAPGDVLTFPLGNRIRVVRIAALALRRGPAEQARGLYQDLSPSIPGDARANA